MLDYLSDFICCLYGKPGAYGEPPFFVLRLWLADAAAVRCAWQLRAACRYARGVLVAGIQEGVASCRRAAGSEHGTRPPAHPPMPLPHYFPGFRSMPRPRTTCHTHLQLPLALPHVRCGTPSLPTPPTHLHTPTPVRPLRRRRHAAFLGAGGHQHLPGRLCAHREPALPRGGAHVQGGGWAEGLLSSVCRAVGGCLQQKAWGKRQRAAL